MSSCLCLRKGRLLFLWTIFLIEAIIALTFICGIIFYPEPGVTSAHPEEEKRVENPIECSCKCNSKTTATQMSDLERDVPLFIITATYPRLEQLAELTRLGQTLKHVNNFLWIVADDSDQPTKLVINLLEKLEIPHHYVLGPMPEEYWKDLAPPKGVSNRNAAISWLLEHLKINNIENGVLYIADDDNTYDLELFVEIRKTQRISVFPVGLVAEMPVSSPVLVDGEITNFYDGWKADRVYPIDMAGFAINVKLLLEVSSTKFVGFPYTNTDQEEALLTILGVPPAKFEPLASNCTKILVWHTRTRQAMDINKFEEIEAKVLRSSNLGQLSKYWCMFMGLKRCDGHIENELPYFPPKVSLKQKIHILKQREITN